ncbi:MAG: hypothetical protein ACREFS_00010 [Acetobacteraceae bacterium]
MSETNASAALLNARYIAIRTAEAKGLTDRLLEAAHDKTPGVRTLVAPLLYRFWHRNRSEGWKLVRRIAEGAVRFPGLIDRDALQLLGEISMPILTEVRHQPEELARLAAIWQGAMARLFASPLARTVRILGRRFVLRKAANVLADVLKRQPKYQPVNYQEMEITFARPASFRAAWEQALACLEHPETAPAPIAAILGKADLPFDLYLMMISERALIYYGARANPADALDLLEGLFHRGVPWFRQSILYTLFHVLSFHEHLEDGILERYDALSFEFFRTGCWRLKTVAGSYETGNQAANADVIAWRHRGGRAPKVIPALMDEAIAKDSKEEIAALFSAIDGVAFYHGNGDLALRMIERAHQQGGVKVEQHVIASLATIRLLDQPQVDAFLERHGIFAGTTPEEIAAAEPSVREEDLVTLLDGFIVHMMLTSDAFRAEVSGAFRRAIAAKSVPEFLVQILEWVRDGLAAMKKA